MDHKIRFLVFFEAKRTKIVTLDQKIIVPDDYHQFWVHFECFLSLPLRCKIATVIGPPPPPTPSYVNKTKSLLDAIIESALQ